MSELQAALANSKWRKMADAAPPADSCKFASSTQPHANRKLKIAASFARRLKKFLSSIKRRAQQHDPFPSATFLPNTSNSPSDNNSNLATPIFGRYSEKFTTTAALSSDTNSASSVLRGGSESELPVLRNVSSSPSPYGNSNNGNRSPLLSPTLLGGFSLGAIKVQHQQQTPLQHHISDDALSRCINSPPSKLLHLTATTTTTTTAATTATKVAIADSPRRIEAATYGDGPTGTQRQQLASLYGTNRKTEADPHLAVASSSFFSCLSGRDNLVDRCGAPPPPPQQPPHLRHPLLPNHLTLHPNGKTAAAVDMAASAAAAMSTMSASAGSTQAPPPSPEQWLNAWEPIAPTSARCSESDSFVQIGRMQGRGLQSPLQPSLQQAPLCFASIQENKELDQATCAILSPGTTPRTGSPVDPLWLSAKTERRLMPAQQYDRPSTARRLAYQAPEMAAAVRAAAAAGGNIVSNAAIATIACGGVGCEGRIRAGMLAAAALQANGTCSRGGGGIASSDAVRHAGSVGSVGVTAATERTMVPTATAAAAATTDAAVDVADGAAASPAVPTPFRSLVCDGSEEPMVAISFNAIGISDCGSGGGPNGSGAGDGAAATTTAVKPPGTAQCGCSPAHAATTAPSCATTTGGATATVTAASCYSVPQTGVAAAAACSKRAAAAAAAATATSAATENVDCGGGVNLRVAKPPQPPQPSQPPQQSVGSCEILALNPGMPAAMRRSSWCLDNYNITRRLYKGSTSAVYKAVCRQSGVQVALKVYFLNRVPGAVLHMICREIEIHAALAHPNIIMLYAAFRSNRHLTLVLEYASRGDLYGIQQACCNRRMDERQAAEVVLVPLLDAVSYLHDNGYCHRDIKPENVLFTSDWKLKLADFGVSIDLSKERAVTRTGTVTYMAPEVARCPLKIHPEDNKLDEHLAYGTACDIWGLGVLTYELLVGFTPLNAPALPPPPYDGGSSCSGGGETAAMQTQPALIFPSCMSRASRDFVARALAVRPEDRPSAHWFRRHPWLTPMGR